VVAHSLVTELLCYVNDKVREQQNWRKTLDISLRLVKQPVERSGRPPLVLAELRVGNSQSISQNNIQVVTGSEVLDLDLDSTRIQVDALSHTLTPFLSVKSCNICCVF